MKWLVVASLLVAGTGVARAEDCVSHGGAIRRETLEYLARMGDLRSQGPAAAPGDAGKAMRGIARFGAAHIDVELRRRRILALYERMVALECPRYTEAGLELTRKHFEELRAQERAALTPLLPEAQNRWTSGAPAPSNSRL